MNNKIESHFNKLTPAEHERLSLLMEECGEVIQVIGKIMRHGYNGYHPEDPTENNRDLLMTEIGHATCAIEMMCKAGDMTNGRIRYEVDLKSSKVKKWLHHQESTNG